MSDFETHTLETAPDEAKPIFEAAEKAYGMVPNLHRKMAKSPVLLEGYWQLSQIFANSSLTSIEQQVVLITVSVVNNGAYCVGVHSVLADMVNVPAEVTEALRTDETLPDTRLQALRKFTQSVVITRGWISDSEVREFIDAGFTHAQALEVILGIGLKILSNYTNHLVDTKLDTAFLGREWQRNKKG